MKKEKTEKQKKWDEARKIVAKVMRDVSVIVLIGCFGYLLGIAGAVDRGLMEAGKADGELFRVGCIMFLCFGGTYLAELIEGREKESEEEK